MRRGYALALPVLLPARLPYMSAADHSGTQKDRVYRIVKLYPERPAQRLYGRQT
jgi:hypothetical protein